MDLKLKKYCLELQMKFFSAQSKILADELKELEAGLRKELEFKNECKHQNIVNGVCDDCGEVL